MTTSVTINAHCDPETTEVEVIIKEPDADTVRIVLQDGETEERSVYDDREIIVREVAK